MRRFLVIALTMVALGAVISPAVGAPSIGRVAEVARKALSTSKQAKRTAHKARRVSVRSIRIARQARRIAQRQADVNANTITIVITLGEITPATARAKIGAAARRAIRAEVASLASDGRNAGAAR